MILAITPNPAVDVTYGVEHVELGQTHRVHDVTERAGGKGLNVARVLAVLGADVTVSGFLGGTNGDEIRTLLMADAVHQDWVEVASPSRRTVTVVHDGVATAFNEAGTPLEEGAWSRLTELVRSRAGSDDVVVVSGSNPPGTRPADLAGVIAAARARGARCVVDTSGPLLLDAARAGADVLKPNAEELAAVAGTADPATGARTLLDAGARSVVVSLGHAGMLALTRDDAGALRGWRARPTEALVGNPTGAGDAVVAALARALAATAAEPLAHILPAALPQAVALSGAAVLRPVAGEVDLPAYERMRAHVPVEELHAGR